MVSDRLKDIIYKKLCEDLSHVEIIDYKGEIWFIDRDKKYWYFIYNKNNNELWWRYSFFSSSILIFSLPLNEFTIIMSSWVEDVLNYKVNTINYKRLSRDSLVEEVLNCTVNTNEVKQNQYTKKVEEVLNYKVNTTVRTVLKKTKGVEDVLNYKVNKTHTLEDFPDEFVCDVLDNTKR
jgi:hypothetical protein